MNCIINSLKGTNTQGIDKIWNLLLKCIAIEISENLISYCKWIITHEVIELLQKTLWSLRQDVTYHRKLCWIRQQLLNYIEMAECTTKFNTTVVSSLNHFDDVQNSCNLSKPMIKSELPEINLWLHHINHIHQL